MMPSRFQSLSTEIFYEIFDYLPTYDLFHAFINVNDYFNSIVGSYPLRVDFRDLSRSKFDSVCSHLRPEQVVSLIFSETYLAEQVMIFEQYFPHFQSEFIHLRHVTFLETEDILLHLPSSVTALTFQFRDCFSRNQCIIDTIVKQASSLTYLKVDSWEMIKSINTSLPLLTHLYVVGHRYYCIHCDLSSVDVSSFVETLRSQIIHFEISMPHCHLRARPHAPLNLNYLSHCLTSLKLVNLTNESGLSMDVLRHLLAPLVNLKELTLILVCLLDVFDGQKWQKFLSQTAITRFDFHLTLAGNVHFNGSGPLLLQSFRSTFWLQKKHWYMAFEQHSYRGRITRRTIYSIPRFLPGCVHYTNRFCPPMSTVTSNYEQQIFYSRPIQSLLFNFNQSIIQPIYRFAHVHRLILVGSLLPSVDRLMSVLDLTQIQVLDLSEIKDLSIDGIYSLIQSMPRLNHLIFEHFIPLFIPPANIYSFTINQWRFSDDLDHFCRIFARVKSLDINIQSHEMIFTLIKRLKHLEHAILRYRFEKYPAYWIMKTLKRKIWHLIGKHLTYTEEDYYVLLSIGKKTKKEHRV